MAETTIRRSETKAEPQGRGPGWKVFGLLVAAGILASLATVPYAMSVGGSSDVPVWAMLVGTLVQGVILTAIAAGLGLWLGGKVGLGAWDIRAMIVGEEGMARRVVRSLPLALLLGAVGAVVIQLVGWLFMAVWPTSVPGMENVELWSITDGLLVSVGAGVTEEIWLRLGMMGVLAWVLSKVARRSGDDTPSWVMWGAMVGAALLFGAAHLPIAATVGDGLTLVYAANVILMNAILGVVFGWLYWKRGLVAAIAAHFATDIVLKVVLIALMPVYS